MTSPTDAKTKISKSSALFRSRILKLFNFIDGEELQCLARQLINIGATYGKILGLNLNIHGFGLSLGLRFNESGWV